MAAVKLPDQYSRHATRHHMACHFRQLKVVLSSDQANVRVQTGGRTSDGNLSTVFHRFRLTLSATVHVSTNPTWQFRHTTTAKILINNCPTRCNTKWSIYYSASSLYMLSYMTNNYIIKWNSSTFRIISFVASTESYITRGNGDVWSDDLLTYKEIRLSIPGVPIWDFVCLITLQFGP